MIPLTQDLSRAKEKLVLLADTLEDGLFEDYPCFKLSEFGQAIQTSVHDPDNPKRYTGEVRFEWDPPVRSHMVFA